MLFVRHVFWCASRIIGRGDGCGAWALGERYVGFEGVIGHDTSE